MSGIPKRSDYQLAYEAIMAQDHMKRVADHTQCSMASPCRQPALRRVTNNLPRRS